MGFLPTDHSGVPSTLVLPTLMPWSQGGSEHNMVCRLGKSELRRNVKALTGGQSFKGEVRKELGSCHSAHTLRIVAGEAWGLHPLGFLSLFPLVYILWAQILPSTQ